MWDGGETASAGTGHVSGVGTLRVPRGTGGRARGGSGGVRRMPGLPASAGAGAGLPPRSVCGQAGAGLPGNSACRLLSKFPRAGSAAPTPAPMQQ